MRPKTSPRERKGAPQSGRRSDYGGAREERRGKTGIQSARRRAGQALPLATIGAALGVAAGLALSGCSGAATAAGSGHASSGASRTASAPATAGTGALDTASPAPSAPPAAAGTPAPAAAPPSASPACAGRGGPVPGSRSEPSSERDLVGNAGAGANRKAGRRGRLPAVAGGEPGAGQAGAGLLLPVPVPAGLATPVPSPTRDTRSPAASPVPSGQGGR